MVGEVLQLAAVLGSVTLLTSLAVHWGKLPYALAVTAIFTGGALIGYEILGGWDSRLFRFLVPLGFSATLLASLYLRRSLERGR